MKVVLVFPVNYAAFGVASPHMQIFSSLCRMGHLVYPAVEGDTLRVVKELNPDFVLATVGIWGDEAHEVSKVCPLVYYSGDEAVNFNQYVAAKPFLVASHAKAWSEEFRKAGVDSFHLPWAADETIYFPVPQEEKDLDIVFVGGVVYPRRWNAIQHLLSQGFSVSVWNTAQTRGISFRDVRDIYSRAKIVFAPSYFDEASEHVSLGRGIPCRIFEAAACKSFQLARRWKDLPEVFPQIETFRTFDEMCEKVDYFLVHDEEREKKAEFAYREFLKKHTYTHRLKILIDRFSTRI